MAFATTEDVGARLGRTLTAGEETTVDYLLDAATAVIVNALGKSDQADVDPVPGILRFVAVEVVCRALANPNSLDSLQEQLGAHSYSARFRDEAGLFLTDDEERLVRRTVFGTASASTPMGSILDELYPGS